MWVAAAGGSRLRRARMRPGPEGQKRREAPRQGRRPAFGGAALAAGEKGIPPFPVFFFLIGATLALELRPDLFMIPIGRETILARFPWATVLLASFSALCFLGTWPRETAFLSARRPDSFLVRQARTLVSLASDNGSNLPADLRVRLEDLRTRPQFPDEETDSIFQSIQNNYEYLNTFKRPDWGLQYAAYLDARKKLSDEQVPWRSVLDRYVFRSNDPLWPRLGTYFWMHAGALHLLVCLYFLWLAGSHMEEVWGSITTVLIYLSGGAVSAAAVWYLLPGEGWVLVGATGAASALLGALLVRRWTEPMRFFYTLGVTYGVFSVPAWTCLFIWAYAVYHIDWLTGGRLNGSAAAWLHGAGFAWGLAVGWPAGLRLRGKEGDSEASPILLDQRVKKAGRLFKEGKAEESRGILNKVLEADPGHLAALQELMAVQEYLQHPDDAGRTAVKIIRTALEEGRGQLADEVFRRWSLRFFQVKLSPQDQLSLAQSLESLQMWREALAYYRSVVDQVPETSFAGKALFASAKIHKDYLRKTDDAAQLLRRLLDPPYDLEWRALAEAELRIIMKR